MLQALSSLGISAEHPMAPVLTSTSVRACTAASDAWARKGHALSQGAAFRQRRIVLCRRQSHPGQALVLVGPAAAVAGRSMPLPWAAHSDIPAPAPPHSMPLTECSHHNARPVTHSSTQPKCLGLSHMNKSNISLVEHCCYTHAACSTEG